jgi:hypothetical protein
VRDRIFAAGAAGFFRRTTAHPRLTLTAAAILMACAAYFLPRLTRDISADAFLASQHPSLVQHRRIQGTFGLSDPMVVAVLDRGRHGVFTPETLHLVGWLTEHIARVRGIDPARVTSLTTAADVFGRDDEIVLEPLVPQLPSTQAGADHVRGRVMQSEMHRDRIVARDGSAAFVIASLDGTRDGAEVYADLLELTTGAPTGRAELHVAGEAAVASYLGRYIDSDARRLYPLAFLVIAAVLFSSYGTVRAVLLPLVVVGGAALVSLGSMAAMDVPFYVITNALPVIVVTIGVADSIHILGRYYENVEAHPGAPAREQVVRTMAGMWRPVTLTSITDIGGFLALGAASSMPPVRAFGVFAAVGSGATLLFSLFVLPACLTLMRPAHARPPFRRLARAASPLGGSLERLAAFVTHRAGFVLTAMLAVVAVGVVGALRVEVNEERIENFNRSDAIYIAHRTIETHLGTAGHLDILIETMGADDLLRPNHLRRLRDLQRFLETLPGVSTTISLVDYLERMDRAVTSGPGTLPAEAALAAQYLLLYSASGRGSRLEEVLDVENRTALVRASVKSGRFSEQKQVVEAAERYLAAHFNTPDMTGTPAGRVEIDYRWMQPLKRGALLGIVLAIATGWLTIAIAMRSTVAGALGIVPVLTAVLLVYGAMGFGGIWLGVGTSMFAAIAIGTAINPAVHVLDRITVLMRERRQPLGTAFSELFSTTGRALTFDLAAVLLGFGVLLLSDVPPLVRFGVLIAASVITSFIATVLLLPALVCLTRPRFLQGEQPHTDRAEVMAGGIGPR